MIKLCPGCQQEKEHTAEFWAYDARNTSGLTGRCRECLNEYNRDRRRGKYPLTAVQREIKRRNHAARPAADRTHIGRKQNMRQRHGLELAEYDAMLIDQGGVCAICGGKDPTAGRRLAVDHCHRTQVIRGLLCGNCNKALGLFMDDPHTVRAAALYLENNGLV